MASAALTAARSAVADGTVDDMRHTAVSLRNAVLRIMIKGLVGYNLKMSEVQELCFQVGFVVTAECDYKRKLNKSEVGRKEKKLALFCQNDKESVLWRQDPSERKNNAKTSFLCIQSERS